MIYWRNRKGFSDFEREAIAERAKELLSSKKGGASLIGRWLGDSMRLLRKAH